MQIRNINNNNIEGKGGGGVTLFLEKVDGDWTWMKSSHVEFYALQFLSLVNFWLSNI